MFKNETLRQENRHSGLEHRIVSACGAGDVQTVTAAQLRGFLIFTGFCQENGEFQSSLPEVLSVEIDISHKNDAGNERQHFVLAI